MYHPITHGDVLDVALLLPKNMIGRRKCFTRQKTFKRDCLFQSYSALQSMKRYKEYFYLV